MDKRNETASIKMVSTGDGISLTTLRSLAFMAYLHQSLRQQTKENIHASLDPVIKRNSLSLSLWHLINFEPVNFDYANCINTHACWIHCAHNMGNFILINLHRTYPRELKSGALNGTLLLRTFRACRNNFWGSGLRGLERNGDQLKYWWRCVTSGNWYYLWWRLRVNWSHVVTFANCFDVTVKIKWKSFLPFTLKLKVTALHLLMIENPSAVSRPIAYWPE